MPKNLNKGILKPYKEMMEESQMIAKAVALKKMGYNIEIKSQG